MTFTEAAAEVLRLIGKPLHYKEITDIAIEKNLLSHVGKSPEVTMGARLAATLKKDASDNPLVGIKPGVFALREWEDRAVGVGLDAKKGTRRGTRDGATAEQDRGGAATDDDAREPPADEDGGEAPLERGPDDTPSEVRRPLPRAADSADDDEPILASPEATEATETTESGDDEEELLVAASPEYAVDEESTDVLFEDGIEEDTFPGDAARVARDERTPVNRLPSAASEGAAHASAPKAHAWTSPDAGSEDDDVEVEAAEDAEDEEPRGPDETMRAEAAAGAAEMFDEEEDDDQPILGTADDRPAAPGAEPADGRRRRRRRRRGRTNGEITPSTGGLPSYTATPAFEGRRDNRDVGRGEHDRRDVREPREPAGEGGFRPQLIELTGGDGHALDDLAGREMSDAVAVILSTFDRNAGAVSLPSRSRRLRSDGQARGGRPARAVSGRRRSPHRQREADFCWTAPALSARRRSRCADRLAALRRFARLEQEALAAVDWYRARVPRLHSKARGASRARVRGDCRARARAAGDRADSGTASPGCLPVAKHVFRVCFVPPPTGSNLPSSYAATDARSAASASPTCEARFTTMAQPLSAGFSLQARP